MPSSRAIPPATSAAALIGAAVMLAAASASRPARAADGPDARAAAVEQQMTPDERMVLLHGIMAIPSGQTHIPPGAIFGAGYVPGIARLGVPALKESDASLGVAYVNGLRKDGATALPSGVAMASTWDPQLVYAGGAMIASEAAAKGFNVLLAGGSNLMRDPRGGRTFEFLGEDPWLTGTLAGAAVGGIQSQHVISTLKHFALNDQETGRRFFSANISDAAARESDLLAFEIALERGHAGAIMCAYNRINGQPSCGNDELLNGVLKHDWGFKGWVMSDWGAVSSADFALAGLDQQSGAQLDPQVFFGTPLQHAAQADPRYAARVADMNRRILRSMFAVGLDAHPPVIKPIDFATDGAVAEQVERAGIVLLRNRDEALPLSGSIRRIAVIGGYADAGVLSGGGSSQVQGPGGASVLIPLGGGNSAFNPAMEFQRSVPLAAIRARVPKAEVRYRNGRYISDAVSAAKRADVAIVFATQWMTEGFDVPDLSLPDGQDALITAVAAANPHTIVVLETGGPVLMPWLDRTAAVIEAWYPGARGAQAIAAVLFGDQNPSGRLPVTFP
ncbi:MAG: glycoside hydrolase family 3 C-terminal domain-containing protein, partial [Steroidobacteraceae bacterium]